MASTKSKYSVRQDGAKMLVEFEEPADFAMVDFRDKSIFISLTFNEKPFDEMITLRTSQDIDVKESSYTFNKEEDKKLRLNLVKFDESDNIDITSDHKFIEKKNHPKADPRGYSVKKPVKKDWDKIISTLDDSEDEEPDANKALKKIYDGCDDDTRRAMEKSLYESQGTVLNMNWGEVKRGQVKPYESSDKFEGFSKN